MEVIAGYWFWRTHDMWGERSTKSHILRSDGTGTLCGHWRYTGNEYRFRCVNYLTCKKCRKAIA